MISIYPIGDNLGKKYTIPTLSELEEYSVHKNVSYYEYSHAHDNLKHREPITYTHPAYETLRKYMGIDPNNLGEVKNIEIDTGILEKYVSHIGHIKSDDHWRFINKFNITNCLSIGDPAYFSSSEVLMYHLETTDTFYSFCYISPENILTDAVIINEKMMEDFSGLDTSTIDIQNNMFEIFNICVDSGCVIFGETIPIEKSEEWFKTDILDPMKYVGSLVTTEGTIVTSGCGDGEYELSMYEDDNQHVAFHITF